MKSVEAGAVVSRSAGRTLASSFTGRAADASLPMADPPRARGEVVPLPVAHRSALRANPMLDITAAGFAGLLGRLPRAGASQLGAAAALAVGSVCRRKNLRAKANLARAGVADTSGACRRGWAQAGRTAFEVLWMLSRSPRRAAENITVHGLDALKEASRAGRGVLLVSAHCGNWETVPVIAASTGLPVSVVARSLRTPRLERRIIAWRKAAGVETLVRGAPGSSVAAYRALASGGVLGCMMDRASTGRRVSVAFLGGCTMVPVGPLALAARSGASIVAGVSRIHRDGRAEISFQAVPIADGNDLPGMAAGVMSVIERYLLDRPEDWLWIYRRQHRCDVLP